MRTSVKLCFTALTAAFLLATAVATSSARNFSVSNQNIRVTWARLDFVGGGRTIECNVTLEGSFHSSTIAKVARTLIGAITRAKVKRPCRGGEAWTANGLETHPRLGRLNNTLPWHITYEAFAGSLPAITDIFLLLSRFRFKIQTGLFGFDCIGLYGNERDNVTGRATIAGGAITSLAAVAGRNIATLVGQLGNAECPAIGNLVGTSNSVTLLGTTTRITVTLI
jgi:hypothetical protein